MKLFRLNRHDRRAYVAEIPRTWEIVDSRTGQVIGTASSYFAAARQRDRAESGLRAAHIRPVY